MHADVFANIGIVNWWPAVLACGRASYLRFWTFRVTFNAQWIARILMVLTMLAEVEFLFFFLFNDVQLCLIALCVRASYLRLWTFKAAFNAQWIARIRMASTMWSEVEFLFFFCSMMISCALSLCARGRRIWDSELLRPLLMLSELRES
jgi:hypothetical protein